MGTKDIRIDAYIEQAAPFAQPILKHLRALVHETCPDVEETVKWGFPHFEYKARNLFHMASFKQHCACGFRLAAVMKDPQGLFQTDEKTAMGQLGRITAIKDLPSDKIFVRYLKEAMKLTEQDVKVPKPEKAKAAVLEVPEYFMAALKKNKKALTVFEQFAPSHRKEYLEWITEAKREETRNNRIAQAIAWMAEGKSRHWKFK